MLCLLLLLGGLVCLSGQATPAKSVWDGIYTDDQASRGEPAYRENCASCHGTRMEGRGQTPPLAGSDFLANWNGMTVGDLLEKMRISMPADRPGRLRGYQECRHSGVYPEL